MKHLLIEEGHLIEGKIFSLLFLKWIFSGNSGAENNKGLKLVN